jgi:hypothetical protein
VSLPLSEASGAIRPMTCPIQEMGCVLEAVEHEIKSSPSLARYLLELEHARASNDNQTLSGFHRLLNDEQAVEA